ncbi:tripartite tricarboxylate transporter substrate-binding protein [Rhodovarius sp.]|uniref:Bug family tripartite tricarboxylate transporter substrate binding protein n=1 Tax=Rhodovarius sp. TaxID=2972673 RepID=UPI00334179EF
MRRRILLAGLAMPALAQSSTIRIISPYTAGGASDILGRFAGQAIGEALGVTVVVENRTGAGGNLGAEAVARAAPDGTTFLVMAAAQAANATLYRSLPFNVLRDFAPVAVIGVVPNLLSVHPAVPAHDVAGFIAFARAQSAGITYSSAGVGTIPHLAMELFRHRAGFQATHVPFRGTAPAVTEVVAGRIQAMMENLPPQAPQIRAGALRGLGVSTAARVADFPDIPAIAETLPGFEAMAWQSLVAPAGTPPAILRRVGEVVLAATAARAGQLRGMGFIPGTIGPDAFPAFLRAEVEKWAEAVRISGATAE